MTEAYDVTYMMQDGLNSLKYTVESIKEEPLYTRVTVDLPGPVKTDEIRPYLYGKMAYFKNQQNQKQTNVVRTVH